MQYIDQLKIIATQNYYSTQEQTHFLKQSLLPVNISVSPHFLGSLNSTALKICPVSQWKREIPSTDIDRWNPMNKQIVMPHD